MINDIIFYSVTEKKLYSFQVDYNTTDIENFDTTKGIN